MIAVDDFQNDVLVMISVMHDHHNTGSLGGNIISIATVILGAGWSTAAGLPLTKDLFMSTALVSSNGAANRFETVVKAWHRWSEGHPSAGAEQFLQDVYATDFPSLLPWGWAVEYVAAVLATPRETDTHTMQNLRYAGRITTPSRCPVHQAFWTLVMDLFQINGVVTTNYDVTIERSLRHRPMGGFPGIWYGGLPTPQVAKGLALPFTVKNPQRFVELQGQVPLFKMHGSLNWSFEVERLVFYQDLRPAFRNGGTAAIIPPLPEKLIPRWLQPVWSAATVPLAASDTWVVCGYSLPPYDHALQELFSNAARNGKVEHIILLDPWSQEVSKRWREVAPATRIVPLPGLPDALERAFWPSIRK